MSGRTKRGDDPAQQDELGPMRQAVVAANDRLVTHRLQLAEEYQAPLVEPGPSGELHSRLAEALSRTWANLAVSVVHDGGQTSVVASPKPVSIRLAPDAPPGMVAARAREAESIAFPPGCWPTRAEAQGFAHGFMKAHEAGKAREEALRAELRDALQELQRARDAADRHPTGRGRSPLHR